MKTFIRKYINEKFYVLGFVESKYVTIEHPEDVFANVRWVDTGSYSKGWFADPFFLSVDENRIILLAEEKVYKKGMGRIVKLTIDAKNYKLLSICPILELDTHLSFPYIFHDKGKTFVCPENRKSGELPLYEYDADLDKLVKRKVLIQEPLVDSQLIKIEGKYYILAVCQNGDPLFDAKLRIYESPSLFGKYTLFQEIVSNSKNKRGAGSIIEKDGIMIRPSQNCSLSYGGSVILNQLLFINGKFEEKPICEVNPNSCKPNGLGLHTFNQMGGLFVIDGKEYKRKSLVKFINSFKKR